jgi:predicted PurR-regulated permease PerM
VSGDIFLHRLVEILPHFSSKRQVVEISRQIEQDISAYLVTITIMNAAVGIVMALAVWVTGVGDPILWGTVAFLLNYVPILGTALGVLIFLLAGLLTIDTLWQALLPAALYVGLHLIEGQTLTPMLLATLCRRREREGREASPTAAIIETVKAPKQLKKGVPRLTR